MSGFEVVTTFAGTVGWRMYCCIGRCKLPRHPGGLRALYPSQMSVLGYCVHEVFRANRLGCWGGGSYLRCRQVGLRKPNPETRLKACRAHRLQDDSSRSRPVGPSLVLSTWQASPVSVEEFSLRFAKGPLFRAFCAGAALTDQGFVG